MKYYERRHQNCAIIIRQICKITRLSRRKKNIFEKSHRYNEPITLILNNRSKEEAQKYPIKNKTMNEIITYEALQNK